MKFSSLVAALAIALALPTVGVTASPELRIPDFSHLRSKASESTDITIDGFLMRVARRFAATHAADEAHDQALSLLQDIKSVRVRNFTFDSDDAYSNADIDSVRKQLQGPGWSALATVRRREPRENVDVYICLDGDKIEGLAVIASEPREFTIVNIVGSIDIDKISQLEGQFGIPEMSEKP
ncbi:MAG TPA: DUF4252 domain-containing protein [Steroidobacteraceae bacterium]|nr:DUF4252 domain-containing protein [Steroidobacteraceae bacterium]